MSYGFQQRPPFRIVAAVDAEVGKPCEGRGKLGCNRTYEANVGIRPLSRDVHLLNPVELQAQASRTLGCQLLRGDLVALLCCPPCTDFSRAKPTNHLRDSRTNTLVGRCGDYVEHFLPEFVVMENARELLTGRNAHHFAAFRDRLVGLGYNVQAEVHMLTSFGLPQIRERALVLASRLAPVRSLRELWTGWCVRGPALTVRHAIGWLADPPVEAGRPNPVDPAHQAPGFASDRVRLRMSAVPPDGGSWYDIADDPDAAPLLIDSMRDRLARNDLGSHCDVYGRLAWGRSATTIKRECAHVGNGRYAHPEQTRLVTVREMSMLQGFPRTYRFRATSLANNYRHIGDAVPPLISYQLSAAVAWAKTGNRPCPEEWVLEGSCLARSDIEVDSTSLGLWDKSALTQDTKLPAAS